MRAYTAAITRKWLIPAANALTLTLSRRERGPEFGLPDNLLAGMLDLDQNPPVYYLVIIGNSAKDAGIFRQTRPGPRQEWIRSG